MESLMRECLSQDAWCDVLLACGGRMFRAHRVVLSSVSPFLRVLLQSRPDEDIPTTIVMPEFAVDAVSAVLHYIYNGEVSVPLQHLEDFFTIVKTLQICVDKKSLIEFREKIEDFDTKILDVEVFQKVVNSKKLPTVKNLNKISEMITTQTKSVQNKQLDLEHVIKGDRICKSVSPYRNDTSYRLTSIVNDRIILQQRRVDSGLQKQDEDRLKDSPLRDTVSDPYPRRNGATTCVPTITNDNNLQPQSSLTNETVRSLPDTSEIPNVRETPSRLENRMSNEDAQHRLECTKNAVPNSTYRNDFRVPGAYIIQSKVSRLNTDDPWRESNVPNRTEHNALKTPILRPVPTLLPINSMYNLPQSPEHKSYFRPPPDLLDLSASHLARFNLFRGSADEERMALLSRHMTNSVSRTLQRNHTNVVNGYHVADHCSRLQESLMNGENELEHTANTKSLVRRAAYNKVMASPWCTRGPVCYRPPQYNQHAESLHHVPLTPDHQVSEPISPASSLVVDECIEDKALSNDNNNNVSDSPATSPPAVEPSLGSGTAGTSGNPHSIEAIIGNDSRSPAMKCATCDKVFTCRSTLAVHVRAHAANARHTCPDCGKSFSQLRNFKYHLSVHRGTREFAATCNVCGKYFNDRGYLSSHMKIHRNRKEYECPHCPKSFNQRVAYNMHVRIHTGVKPHVCSECGKAFSRKMLLKQHQRTHSGERPYACSVCDKRFADRSNMTLHMRLHSGVKPFSCTLCPKSFTKKHHLKTHLNYHTGDKPYSCPRCNLAFSQSSNMRTHLKKCSAPGSGSPPSAGMPQGSVLG